MHTLFTPWRFEYLTSPSARLDCIFCAASSAEDPAEVLALYRDERVIVMLNRFPYSNGHLMVAPRTHASDLYDTDDQVLFSVIRLTAEAQRILSETYSTDGFNIGMNIGRASGAGFADHYHMHVVPRWNGDSNFMTVTAQTRLVPEDLDSTMTKLQPKFDAIARLTTTDS